MLDPQHKPIRLVKQVKQISTHSPLKELPLKRSLLKQLSDEAEGTAKFCEAVGLEKIVIGQIISANSDWEFVLKIDALLETAAKAILRKRLIIRPVNGSANDGAMEGFLDALPLSGKSSVVRLLTAVGCAEADIKLIDSVRTLRNAYAHNITNLNASLIELISGRNRNLLMQLSQRIAPTSAELLAIYRKDTKSLRYDVFFSTLRFLNFAYRIGVKRQRIK